MKKLILLTLLMTSFASHSAPVTYKQYFDNPSQYALYLKGFEQGITLSQVMTVYRELGTKLYCSPQERDLSIDEIEEIVQGEAKRILGSGARTQEQIDKQPIGAMLIVGLEQKYPCK
jgi:hypothetical protein